jgi:hypothetical protein
MPSAPDTTNVRVVNGVAGDAEADDLGPPAHEQRRAELSSDQ